MRKRTNHESRGCRQHRRAARAARKRDRHRRRATGGTTQVGVRRGGGTAGSRTKWGRGKTVEGEEGSNGRDRATHPHRARPRAPEAAAQTTADGNDGGAARRAPQGEEGVCRGHDAGLAGRGVTEVPGGEPEGGQRPTGWPLHRPRAKRRFRMSWCLPAVIPRWGKTEASPKRGERQAQLRRGDGEGEEEGERQWVPVVTAPPPKAYTAAPLQPKAQPR